MPDELDAFIDEQARQRRLARQLQALRQRQQADRGVDYLQQAAAELSQRAHVLESRARGGFDWRPLRDAWDRFTARRLRRTAAEHSALAQTVQQQGFITNGDWLRSGGII